MNSDFSSQDEVNKLLDTWEEHNPADDSSMSGQEEEDVQDGVTGGAQRSFLEDLVVMFRRHASLIVRDPVLYLGRCVMILMTNLVFAFVYWNARKWEQSQAPNKHFLNIWFAGVATNSKFAGACRVTKHSPNNRISLNASSLSRQKSINQWVLLLFML